MAFGFTRKPAFLPQFTEDLRLYHMARFGLTKLLFTEYAFKVGFFADFHLTCYSFKKKNQITKSSEPFHYSFKSRERGSQLGRSPMDRALASHHESRGSNPGANKCHAQVR